MFERFTDRARRVLVLAQEEARLLNHDFIGTEHILLGLIHEREGIAARALEHEGVALEAARESIEEIVGSTSGLTSPGGPPFTPRAKKALELSLREALRLACFYIGTEHILLGLLREGTGVAMQVLDSLNVDRDALRRRTEALVSDNPDPGGSTSEVAHLTGSFTNVGSALWGPSDASGYTSSSAQPPRLVRSMPGPATSVSLSGGTVRVLSVEIYDVAVGVSWLVSLDSSISEMMRAFKEEVHPPHIEQGGMIRSGIALMGELQEIRLTDDLDTSYEIVGRTDGRNEREFAGRSLFAPAPPATARRLGVQWPRGAAIPIELPEAP